MKQQLKLKQQLKQTKAFNTSKAASLKILELNNDELFTYIKSQISNSPFLGFSSSRDEDSDAFLNYDHTQLSLYDEIMDQLRFSKENPDINICEIFLANLDSNGYFKPSKTDLRMMIPTDDKEYKRNLTILRKCEPYGCFAFTLEECLKLQFILSPKKISHSALLLCDYLEEIATSNLDGIKAHTKLDEETILDAISFIKTLNPKPAANYSSEAQYANPEFKISVEHEQIKIQLLNDDLKVYVNEEDSSEMKTIMKEQRAQVNMLMNYLQRRNVTLTQIMQSICDIQKEFFLYHKDLKKCTLKMIADNVGVSISTVSRALSNKSCEFENKYYLLNSFLSSGGSEEHSQNHIKKRIKEMIEQEDKTNPLSDEQLRLMLEEEGIHIARRTVAKYRDSNFIFSSSKRKIKQP
ncbi:MULTISPECIES: LacI family DNA-binding transcriptional regulator [unclassified Breznakia]|uniref:RNA polymerase factor sigma-54 n=1 Tax=unclassified Breznakia TaxID=2623764 RepID=UPI00240617E9|nr:MULTISPECIES: LacI family DNA-binding transcriptional regulator [unclassified Breznakia]MDF9837425.1 RNA polymerase sigma-54 factor [Breznakia sp. PFB2-8]MDF9859361.1 RNA polymerase sigma-54 factor [Breznakia sp. PH5-24]